jgi:hypothetical protein
MCVYFLPTHTIGESVLPAHFLRAFVGLFGRFSCRSFHVDRSVGRPRSCGNYPLGHILAWVIRARLRWVILWFMWVIIWFRVSCGICSLDHSFRGSYSLRVFCAFSLVVCGRLCPFVSCLLVGSFHVYFLGFEVRDLGRGVLEGNFCTVESL